jgi:hypothetical protein
VRRCFHLIWFCCSARNLAALKIKFSYSIIMNGAK